MTSVTGISSAVNVNNVNEAVSKQHTIMTVMSRFLALHRESLELADGPVQELERSMEWKKRANTAEAEISNRINELLTDGSSSKTLSRETLEVLLKSGEKMGDKTFETWFQEKWKNRPDPGKIGQYEQMPFSASELREMKALMENIELQGEADTATVTVDVEKYLEAAKSNITLSTQIWGTYKEMMRSVLS